MNEHVNQIAELGPIGFGCASFEGIDVAPTLVVRYTFPSQEEDFNLGRILFGNWYAYKWTTDHAVVGVMIDAFNRLAEVIDSPWATEVMASLKRKNDLNVVLRHYMVYFDDYACIEVIAESVSIERGVSPHGAGG